MAAITVTINPPVKIWLEAENAYLNPPMTPGYDDNASGGGYIMVPDGKGDVLDPWQDGAGYAEYTFEVPISGDYMVWGRVIANGTADDSLFVSMDYGEYVEWYTALGAKESWIWDQVRRRTEASPAVFYLDAGTHTLIIKQREDGLKLDQILITSIPNAFGAATIEDAEDGFTDGWEIYHSNPPGARVHNVFDEERQSNVIELTGPGSQGGYLFPLNTPNALSKPGQSILEWTMEYGESFYLFIDVETTIGRQSLIYLPIDLHPFSAKGSAYFGLGSGLTDGQWHHFVCNLQENLAKVQPGIMITEVDSFLIYGSGRVDDIKMR